MIRNRTTFNDTDNTDITDTTHNIITKLSHIVTWLTPNKLLINTSKTLIDEVIEIVNDFKFIGIMINKQNYEMDITHRINRKYNPNSDQQIKAYPTLTHTAHFIQYINSTTHILRFTTMGIWQHKILQLQKRANRTITCSKYNAHTEPHHKTINILKLPDVYNLLIYKIILQNTMRTCTTLLWYCNTYTYSSL